MTILPHVAAGAAIGSFIPNPYLSSAVGFFSHFILDAIPHYDPPITKKILKTRGFFYLFLFLIDLSLSVYLLSFLASYPNMFWAGLIAALVDLDNFGFILYKIGFKIHHPTSIWHKKTNMIVGLFNQSWVTGLGLIIIYLQLTG